MLETRTTILHFDPPFPGLAGGTILPGWLVPKPGHHYADVRAIVGPATFPGIHGIPRRDLAEFFEANRPHLLAGFWVTMTLPAGRHRVTLEGLALTGTWELLGETDWTVSAAEARPTVDDQAPLNSHELAEALRVVLRRLGAATPLAEAVAGVIRETPPRHHLRHPPLPFHGHLDQPRTWDRSTFGRLAISGWFYHETQRIKRVLVTTDLQAMQEVRYGRETPFLADRAANAPTALHCGYDGFLDLPAQFSSPVSVRVYAELEDGSWHLGSVARFSATDQEFRKQAFADYSPFTFWRAWRALVRGMKSLDWHLPPRAECRAAARLVWREYAASASRARQRPRPPLPPAASTSRGPVHLFTHNLNHEGAPLFLLEYARTLRAAGETLVVVSPADGPLRTAFTALGATIRLVDQTALLSAATPLEAKLALETLAEKIDLTPSRLVVANTLSSWWGVLLAHEAHIVSLFYIHESSPPRNFFHGLSAAGILPLIEETFRLASRVSFLTPATRRYYDDLSDRSNYVIQPGWIDLAAIDRFRAGHSRDSLRATLGLPPAHKLVINVGTFCERKGQHLFARAVDLLWQDAPELAANALFLMIGGGDTPYDRDLAQFLSELNLPNLRAAAGTADVYSYYGAADLFVCSSYEESFPRVVLEAMAFELPILSTRVHGIPEIARSGCEARLIPPGDSSALASALRDLLTRPQAGQALARAARLRVATEFDGRVLLPRHLALTQTLLSSSGRTVTTS